jgi:hypothetical protein
MNQPEPIRYLIDNNANLHIQDGKKSVVLPPSCALDLLKFLERTQFQQNANAMTKGTAQ